MKIEAFKDKDKKKRFIIGFTVICLALIVGAFLYRSYAWFEDENTFNSFSGNVQQAKDLYFSFYLNNKAVTTMPDNSGAYLFDHAECTNGATVTWDNVNWEPLVSLNSTRTKCMLYFTSASTATLAKLTNLNNTIKLNESMNDVPGECPTYNTQDKTIDATNGEDDSSLLCEAEDDYGPTYYFRGNVTNNYVSFAGFIWRIVRIDGDGSIRMVYDGITPYDNIKNGESPTNGTNRQIGSGVYNTSEDDNAHVAYSYRESGQSSYANTFNVLNGSADAISSTIKTTLDNWYNTNISTANRAYISTDTIFCNDKNLYHNPSEYQNYGFGSINTRFRWSPLEETIAKITLTCQNNVGTVSSKNDAFTVSSKGNAALTYPIGLLTADEVATNVGLTSPSTGLDTFLRTGSTYWTMTPYAFVVSEEATNARVRFVNANGGIYNGSHVNASLGIRPVIALKNSVTLSGSGTMNNPFTVS